MTLMNVVGRGPVTDLEAGSTFVVSWYLGYAHTVSPPLFLQLACRFSTCNIHKLQRCQNTAARLILQQSSTPSLQDLMNQLHWLPIGARIAFKIATLTYKALSSGQPAYLRELVSPYTPSRQVRSSDQSLLTIPCTNLTIGQRAFSCSSPAIWNSIPLSVRNAPTISTFKRRLKSFHFRSPHS